MQVATQPNQAIITTHQRLVTLFLTVLDAGKSKNKELGDFAF